LRGVLKLRSTLDPFVQIMRALRASILGVCIIDVAARSFMGDHQQRYSRRQSSVLAFASILSEDTLWAIRAASAASSYIGLVAFMDRPQGTLNVHDDGNQVEIRQSTVEGAGLGLFATTTLRRNTILGTFPGVVLPLQQNLEKLRKYPACEAYVWRFSDNKSVIDPTNTEGVLDPQCRGGNPSLPGSILLFQTLFQWMTVKTTLCRINEPPLGKDVNVVTEEDLGRRCVTFLLERDVYPGEELFIDYGLSYDRSAYGRGSEKEETAVQQS
jgi:hypothetical protein